MALFLNRAHFISVDNIYRWANDLPKSILSKEEYSRITLEKFGDKFRNSRQQTLIQHGLYYLDKSDNEHFYHPRFTKEITYEEAKRYAYRWAWLFSAVNPRTAQAMGYEGSYDRSIVRELISYLQNHNGIIYLKDALSDILNINKNVFEINDAFLAFLLFVEVFTIERNEPTGAQQYDNSTIELVNNYQEIMDSVDQLYFHRFDESINNNYGVNQGPTAQTIYYGCPGTGKSFDVMEIAEGKYGEKVIWYSNVPDEEGNYHRVLNPSEEEKEKLTCNVFRTTFHPDYDYATFVGCYKPVKENDKLDYRFIPQVFTNAYVSALHHPEDPTYLIIEEINRGNCAQIFGDLFQLLDRTDGVSRYPIKPDTELSKYLASQGIPSENLKLPANLHLYATMNTSDQSLFPMDSAFKRRWAMEYKPIDYKHKIAKDYTITIGEDTNPNKEVYPWLKFLLMVNELIINATDSEDKQMGEFFIKSSISEKEFKNKVMFFIWNDVCKDYYNPRRVSPLFFMKIAHPKDNEKNYFTFAELFGPRNKDSRLLLEFILFLEQSYKERHPETVLNDKGKINWEETDKLDFPPQTSDKADSE